MFKTSGQLLLNTADRQLLDPQRGRQLYRVYHEQAYYWLKLQQHGFSPVSEQAFLHELALYQQLAIAAQPNRALCLPHQMLDLQAFDDRPDGVLAQVLCVQDSQALFAELSLMDLSAVVHALIQSLDVLARLHGAGFIHGDLKTVHFRLAQRRCYLIDFEQSHAIHAVAEKVTKQTATPRYMAPELFHGQVKTIQSDIYALGVIWLQWLSQQRWASRRYMDWAIWHCQLLTVELPMDFRIFESILGCMLAKHCAQRYTCTHEIKHDLLKVV